MRRRIAAALDALMESPIGLVVLLVFLIACLYVTSNHWHPAVEFYSLVAQVIPVLLLAAAVEGRYFRPQRTHTSLESAMGRAFLLMAMHGEAFALVVVARQHDSQFLRAGTVFGLIVVVAVFIVFALYGPATLDDAPPGLDDESA